MSKTCDEYRPSQEILDSYIIVRKLPDGRWIGVLRLMFHYTIHVDINDFGYEDRWCIDTIEHALESFARWDGISEPLYWHKHPKTGMRRDILTDERWHESERSPSERASMA